MLRYGYDGFAIAELLTLMLLAAAVVVLGWLGRTSPIKERTPPS